MHNIGSVSLAFRARWIGTVLLPILLSAAAGGNVPAHAACLPPPPDLVSWWPGDGHAFDLVGQNNATLVSGATYAPGRVGEAFSLDGNVANFVEIPNDPSLNPVSAFTVNGWFYIDPNAPGNDADDAIDGNHGTAMNGATYAAGMADLAFDLDGLNDHVVVPDSPSLDFTNALTLEAWIYRRDSAHAGILNKGALRANGVYDLAFYQDNIYFRLNAASLDMPSNATIPVGRWTHVAGTYDGSDAKIYINGILDASQPYTGQIDVDDNPLHIGLCGSPATYFNGLVDELGLLDRALAAEEVAAIHAASSAGKCVVATAVVFSDSFETGGTGRWSATVGGP